VNPSLSKAGVAEAIGTFALCFVGILASKNTPDLLGVALASGLTVAVMAAAFGPISGGQLNPAVTAALWVAGRLNSRQTGILILAQLAGACAAGYLLVNMFSDTGKNLVAAGTPGLGAGVTRWQGLAAEAVTTFFWAAVYFGTMADSRRPNSGGWAVGLTVTIGMLAVGPISGAALNPARAFGPALASGQWGGQWIFWAGPLLGGVVAGLICGRWLNRMADSAPALN
jgi:MIP family channel proteins